MKKFITGILALLYLTLSSGVVLEVHYCMGKRAGAELFGSRSDTCGLCGMTEKDTGCCHDEVKFYKLEDLHKNVTNATSAEPVAAIISRQWADGGWLQQQFLQHSIPYPLHPPPLLSEPSIHILNCVFRI